MTNKTKRYKAAALSAVLVMAVNAGYSQTTREEQRAGAAQFETGPGLKELMDGQIQDLPLPQIEPAGNFTADSPVDLKTTGPEVGEKYDYILQKQSPDNLSELSAPQIKSLFYKTSNNKVAALDKVAYYDPSGELGFCFGRAMAAHLLGRRMGLKEQSTGKVFIIGDLKSGETTEWRFHVTAVVRGPGKDWFAIDPIMTGPMPVGTWIKEIRAMVDKRIKAKIYFTHSDAVIPDVRVFPAPDEEKGERIIELAFDPGGKPGFKPFTADFEPFVFSVDENAANKYFINVHENPEADSFDFLGLTVNGDRYDYRNYFADLAADIGGRKRGNESAVKSLSIMSPWKAAGPAGKRLFSPGWGAR
ncbi:MAG: hypothetical protein KKH28_12340 [Elusimicrobia bacterium]|nr:hypothetical protein [Elusimicrobiota bacterium]